MRTYKIPKNKIANYLINRSFLQEKAKSINKVLEYYSCIQVDPINIVARSHELALFNRVKNFKTKDLYYAMYNKRELFEYWLQLYSIIPVKFFPYLSSRRQVKDDWQNEYYKTHKKQIDNALKFIKDHGPTSVKELQHIKKASSLFSWNGNESRSGILKYLWDTGELMVHHRKGNQKYFDLTERIIARKYLDAQYSLKESLTFYLESSFKYLGIVRKSFLQQKRIGYSRKLPIMRQFEEKLKKGGIIELKIPEVNTIYYVLENQLDEIKKLSNQNRHEKLNVLSPLDPLIIDRKLIEDIFDFSYRWEGYTPKSERKFGYYNMPILCKGRFVGQIDLKKNKCKKINILNLHLLDKNKKIVKNIDNAIDKIEKLIK